MPTSPERAASRLERMAIAVELHEQGLRQQEIGDKMGITQVSAGRLLRAAGVTTHAPGKPAKYPQPEPRACENCETVFTPQYPSLAVGPHGRFCSPECRVAGLRKHEPVGARVCANPKCDRTFTPHPGNAHRGGGIYCSAECRKTGETIRCRQCRKKVYLPKSHASRSAGFCSRRCAAIHGFRRKADRFRGFDTHWGSRAKSKRGRVQGGATRGGRQEGRLNEHTRTAHLPALNQAYSELAAAGRKTGAWALSRRSGVPLETVKRLVKAGLVGTGPKTSGTGPKTVR